MVYPRLLTGLTEPRGRIATSSVFAAALSIPGAWLATSLALFLGTPLLWAGVLIILLFPAVPFAWVVVSHVWRSRRTASPHRSTLARRFAWRSALTNVTFLVLLLLLWPRHSFLAVAIHGDWMLDGRTGSVVDTARWLIFETANGIGWLDAHLDTNPFERVDDPDPVPPETPDCTEAVAEPAALPRGTIFSMYDMFSGGCGHPGPSVVHMYRPGTNVAKFAYESVIQDESYDEFLAEAADRGAESTIAHVPSPAEPERDRFERFVLDLGRAESQVARYPDWPDAYLRLGKANEDWSEALRNAGAPSRDVEEKSRAAADAFEAGCRVFVQASDERAQRSSSCERLVALRRVLGDEQGIERALAFSEAARTGGPDAIRGERSDAPSIAQEPRWPMAPRIDPIVRSLPPGVETSIESVGRHIAAKTPNDPYRRVKALHDYVVHRVSYDHAALELPRIPAEAADAGPVWQRRKGVCAGYSRLFVELATAAGIDAVYLTGDVRDGIGGLSPHGHAWNAARIGGSWYLIDTTWNDPGDDYRTHYLLAPPSVFGLDHFPDDPGWQLRAPALDRAAFVRQPLVEPAFAAAGLVLHQPVRPQVDAGGSLVVVLENPRKLSLSVEARPDSGAGTACRIVGTTLTKIRCEFERQGTWRVVIFGGRHEDTSLSFLGQIYVNATP